MVRPEDVILRPHRKTDHGDLASLTEYMHNTDGEIPPAAVARVSTSKYVILHGERRWLAGQPLEGPARVVLCETWADFLAWMILDKNRENPARMAEPLNLTGVLRLTQTITKYLRPGRDDRMDATLAEYFGERESRIGPARSVFKVMTESLDPRVRDYATEQWKEMEEGIVGSSAAFERIRRYEKQLAAPPVDAKAQRAKLNGIVGVCHGLVDGLTGFGDASPELTEQERAAYIEALGGARRALDQVVRSLRGGAA